MDEASERQERSIRMEKLKADLPDLKGRPCA
jgi:hypothetical protein